MRVRWLVLRPFVYLLLLLGASCNLQTATPLPEDPVELAKALGDFRLEATWPWGSGDPEEDASFTWIYSPKDPNALNAGRILLGYPDTVPGPRCAETNCSYEGGVGREWVKPLPSVRPYFNADPTLWPFVHAMPEGEFWLEQYLRVYGRWYRFEARARVYLRDEGRRFGVETFPVKAYPLEELPEIYPYDKVPPVTVAAVCAQPGGYNPRDPWASYSDAPYYLWSSRNAVQKLIYEYGRLLSNSYEEPLGWYEYCPLCPTLSGIRPGRDLYYDIFVRMVNTEPRQARAYGLWWRVYNQEPLRVERNPDGTYACVRGFSWENLNRWEGPFTLEELRARYGIDPANPPQEWVGPR